MALAIAVTRAFIGNGVANLGNFWVDMTRSVLYVLLPLSIVMAFAFVATGVPQTLAGSVDATTIEGAKQSISLGPVASQEAIKQLGYERRRIFQCQRGASVRKSKCVVKHSLDLEHVADLDGADIYIR